MQAVNMDQLSTIHALPNELLIHISGYLETSDLRSLAITSKRLHACSKSSLSRQALSHRVRENGTNLTVFQWAALDILKRRNMFMYLLEEGVDWSVRYSNGRSPLHVLSSQGDAPSMRRLIEAGCSPRVLDKEGNTPLVYACRRGHTVAVKTLLNATAFSSTQLSKALCVAAKGGYLEPVKVLCDYGADLAYWDWLDQGPAIWCAASHGHDDVVQVLLDYGADPCTRGLNSLTALHGAVGSGNSLLVQRLLSLPKSSLHEVDNSGCSPLQLAIRHGKANIAEMLISKGAK